MKRRPSAIHIEFGLPLALMIAWVAWGLKNLLSYMLKV